MTVLMQEMRTTRGLAGWVDDIAQNVTAWRAYRETVEQLSRCNEHELEDLGMARGDIRDIAWRATFGRGR